VTTALSQRRLPGFRFEAQPPPLADKLPRMDVALFVGFAAAGPLHLPVVVEDAAQFEAIYGADAPLAWDRARGERVQAHLAPAVRAFFRNGGRRCWVVRVAGTARANLFPLSGLARRHGKQSLQPAYARARARGSWSDSLRAGVVLTPRLAVLGRFSSLEDFELEVSAPDEVVAGDLLRLTYEEGFVPLVHVKAVEPLAGGPSGVATAGGGRRLRVRVRGGEVQWLRLPGRKPSVVSGVARVLTARGRRIGARVHTTPGAEWHDMRPVTLTLDLPSMDAPALGSVVRATFGKERLWVRADEVRMLAAEGPGPKRSVQVTGEAVWLYRSRPGVALGNPARCDRLLFELHVRQGEGAPARLKGLAFGPGHPRYWAALPTDEQLYAEGSVTPAHRHAEVWRDAAGPRFPLAGRGEGVDRGVYFPVLMPTFTAPHLGPLQPRTSALKRDGLSSFGAGLFLDRGLREVGLEALPAQADFLRYQSPRPRRLWGIHAALSVEEATVIAVPDAVHRGWGFEEPERPEPEPSKPMPNKGRPNSPGQAEQDSRPLRGEFIDCRLTRLEPPSLLLERQDEAGTLTLSWSSPLDEWRFVVEESSSPGWRDAATVYAGKGRQLVLAGRDPQRRRYYRIRTEVNGLSGEWLELEGEYDEGGALLLAWPTQPRPVYILEEATLTDWGDAATVYEGTLNRLTLYSRHDGDYFYRVRVVSFGGTSDWSQGVAAHVGGQAGWQQKPPEAFRAAPLLEIHCALLRMCAARGDLFAVLALPAHYREGDAVRHAARLAPVSRPSAHGTTNPPALNWPLGERERRALSYGALYHPWLVSRESDLSAKLRLMPPCGAAVGIIALRAFQRGAWVAPANESFRGVVSLTPRIAPAARPELQEARVNLIGREPQGILSLSADTLSEDEELRPIGVRRLLILLRRLALRLGSSFVFEPHSDAFRRMVRRGFEGMLGEMFQRGAFAGATPSSSFRVETGDELNTPRLIEQGRFIVELKVAPSLPLTFLTLRLVQSGDRGLATEER